MNELEIALTRTGPNRGYIRAVADEHFPGFSRFQPSAGTGMGFDDLKVVEAARFLTGVTGGPTTSSNIHDAVASARVLDAAERSAASGRWVELPLVAGATANTKEA
jgi:predicted dehydrogenase